MVSINSVHGELLLFFSLFCYLKVWTQCSKSGCFFFFRFWKLWGLSREEMEILQKRGWDKVDLILISVDPWQCHCSQCVYSPFNNGANWGWGGSLWTERNSGLEWFPYFLLTLTKRFHVFGKVFIYDLKIWQWSSGEKLVLQIILPFVTWAVKIYICNV